jgi:hypothetical protein
MDQKLINVAESMVGRLQSEMKSLIGTTMNVIK